MTAVRIEAARTFPVALEAGFDYITDLAHWPDYWPGFVALDPASRWRDPGDRARVTLRMLRRDVTLEMTLLRFDPHRLVEYRSRQRGLPDVAHRRRFDAVDGRLRLAITVEYEPRAWRGGLDRVLLRRAAGRAVHDTLANLDRCFTGRASAAGR